MSEEAVDLNEFLERVQDDKELLIELFDIFLEDFVQKRELLNAAVQSQNFDEIGSIAHSVKGASGNISAKPIREIFLDIENMGNNNDISGIDEKLTLLDEKFEALKERITAIKTEFES